MWAGSPSCSRPAPGLAVTACAPAQPPMETGETTRRANGASPPWPTFTKVPAGLCGGPVRRRLVGARTPKRGFNSTRWPSRRRMAAICAQQPIRVTASNYLRDVLAESQPRSAQGGQRTDKSRLGLSTPKRPSLHDPLAPPKSEFPILKVLLDADLEKQQNLDAGRVAVDGVIRTVQPQPSSTGDEVASLRSVHTNLTLCPP